MPGQGYDAMGFDLLQYDIWRRAIYASRHDAITHGIGHWWIFTNRAMAMDWRLRGRFIAVTLPIIVFDMVNGAWRHFSAFTPLITAAFDINVLASHEMPLEAF